VAGAADSHHSGTDAFDVSIALEVTQEIPMPTRKMDMLMWAALTDTTFREGLLNGRRPELVSQLNMTDTEKQAILAIRADSLEAFAGALCQPVAGAL
jgi:hypothetical protein